jgi:hypothetical protein
VTTTIVSPANRLDTLPAVIPKLTLGWAAAGWISKYLHQPNGPRAGQRFKLTTRQLRFLLHWYALKPDGSWVYHHGVRRLAKGSGKSPCAAVLALVEFCGPVRLDEWIDDDPINYPGGCSGKRVTMPLVQIAAVSEDQCKNTMRMIRAFAPKGSRVVRDHHLDPGLTKYYSPDGELHVMTSSSKTAEGAESTAVLADEVEWWCGTDGAEFMNTLADNLAKSGSRMVETANAWKPDVQSQAQATWDTWVAQEEDLITFGRTKSESLVLYDAVVAPPETDLADPESLRAALDFVYADCEWKGENDIRAIMTRIWHKSSSDDDSKRKYLNWPIATEGAWCDPQVWATLAGPRELEDGERIVIFFDGSKTHDATACVGCALDDGYIFTIGIWEPKEGVPVDFEQIDNRITGYVEKYDVVAFFADVREWEGYVKTTWPQRWKDDLQVWAVPGGKLPEPIAWDMRQKSKDFALAAELVEDEITEGAFAHDDNAVLARHVGNARRHESRWNGAITVEKESKSSPKKIDGCVAMIGARMTYRLALAGAKPDEPSEAFAFKRW